VEQVLTALEPERSSDAARLVTCRAKMHEGNAHQDMPEVYTLLYLLVYINHLHALSSGPQVHESYFEGAGN